jgi:hypothetical protein
MNVSKRQIISLFHSSTTLESTEYPTHHVKHALKQHYAGFNNPYNRWNTNCALSNKKCRTNGRRPTQSEPLQIWYLIQLVKQAQLSSLPESYSFHVHCILYDAADQPTIWRRRKRIIILLHLHGERSLVLYFNQNPHLNNVYIVVIHSTFSYHW